MGDVDDLTTVQDMPEAPEQCSPGDKQRLRIFVPNVNTALSMGAKAPGGDVRDLDSGATNYDGFGVHTEGHIWMEARETMTYQSTSSGVVQAQGSLSVGGKEGLVAGSRKGVVIAGGGGVTILGGAPKSWPDNPQNDGSDPQEPKWVAPINEASAWVTAVASATDAALGAIAGVKGAFGVKSGFKDNKLLGLLNVAQWGGGIAGTLASGIGATAAVASLAGWKSSKLDTAGDMAAGTLIYGHSGLIAASRLTIGIHSLAGNTMFSVAGNSITAAGGNDFISLLGTSMKSLKGDVEIGANKKATVVGYKEAELAARTGGLSLKGKRIAVGSRSGSGQQAATESAGMFAKAVVALASKNLLSLEGVKVNMKGATVGISGDKVTVGGGEKAAIKAAKVGLWGDNNVAMGTPGFFVNVSKKNLKLGNIRKALPAEPLYEPPKMADVLEALASETPMAELKALKADAVESYQKKLDGWLDKVAELQHKNCSIELKDGDIKLEVHGFKFKIDSSKTAVAGSLKIMK
jgi:hypothetical protein